MTKCLVSWSSGKDSAWMVHVLRRRGDVAIGALLTTVNASAQRVAMHGVRVEVLEAQAAAIGAPLWIVPIPYPCPNEVYERAMAEAVRRAVGELVASGVKARITCVNPKMLDARFAGREFDAALLGELPASVDPCAERGEFHTCAYDGPMFSQPIAVETGITVERDGFVFTDLCLTRSASSV
jgi:diphthamide synthase (EF-2-diphthine--ammonia ligase)